MTNLLAAQGRPVTACQRCRGFKVACDRARPTCTRCARADVACEYGPPSAHPGGHEADSERMEHHHRLSGPSSIGSESPSSGAHDSRGWPFSSDIVSDMLMQSLALPRDSPSAESLQTPEPTPPERAKSRIKLKRDRAILSCIRCRKHKVRCDRKVPCGRCVQNRRESHCVYTESTHTPSRGPVLEDQGAHHLVATRFVEATWESQFRNGTHWKRLLTEMKDHLPPTHAKEHDFNIHNEPISQTMTMSINYPFSGDGSSAESVRRIVFHLPPQALQKIFVSQYMNTVEKVYHLLDESSWEQELQQFWEDTSSLPDDWLAQYLMILALGCQAHNSAAQAHGAETYPNLPSRLTHGAEVCLKRTPYMFKSTLANIRTLCLTVILKQVCTTSCEESDACWPLTGLIKRLCIKIGLHLQADPARNPDPNDARTKRRLWAAVVFLEMRQSLVCGMPLMLQPSDMSCFTEPSEPTPERSAAMFDVFRVSRAENTHPNSLATTFAVSGSLLFEALYLATSADSITYARAVEVDTAIRQQLKQSGIGLTTEILGEEAGFEKLDLEACAIYLFFRLVLMALHSRFALQPAAPTDYPVSYVSSLESALAILSYQRLLCDGGSPGQQSTWVAGLFRHEFFTAAMTVCSQLVREGRHLGLPSSCDCEGRPQEIVLDALQSCRDVLSRGKHTSVCNANAFAVVDHLVRILREEHL